MGPFKKILVPLDFSPHSDEATRMAADLSKRFEASVTLAHVYAPIAYALVDSYVVLSPTQLAEMLTGLERRLATAKEGALSAGAPRVETTLLQGQPATEIVTLAAAQGFDLIVMGTHGRTGLKHALMGSVAERVLRNAPCPVLTLKAAQAPG